MYMFCFVFKREIIHGGGGGGERRKQMEQGACVCVVSEMGICLYM